MDTLTEGSSQGVHLWMVHMLSPEITATLTYMEDQGVISMAAPDIPADWLGKHWHKIWMPMCSFRLDPLKISIDCTKCTNLPTMPDYQGPASNTTYVWLCFLGSFGQLHFVPYDMVIHTCVILIFSFTPVHLFSGP